MVPGGRVPFGGDHEGLGPGRATVSTVDEGGGNELGAESLEIVLDEGMALAENLGDVGMNFRVVWIPNRGRRSVVQSIVIDGGTRSSG